MAEAVPPPEGDCGMLELDCHLGELAGNVLTDIAEAFVEGLTAVTVSITTVWVSTPSPNLTGGAGGASDTVVFLQDSLRFYTLLLLIASFSIGLAKIAWEFHQAGRGRAVRELARSLLTFLVINGSIVTVIGLLLVASDGFAEWIIDRSVVDGDFGSNLTRLLAFGGTGGPGTVVAAIMLILGFLALIVGLIQLVLSIARGGLLVLVAGVLPTASAFRNLEAGEMWFRRFIGWTVALLLYKPAAAIVYAVGFRLAGQDVASDDGVLSMVTGFLFLSLAVLVMPALMKFTVPLVAAVQPGGAGGGGGGAAMVGAVATGGMVLRGFSSSGGGPGSNGPTGSTGMSGFGGGPGSAGPTGTAGTAGATGTAAAGPTGAALAGASAVVSATQSSGNSATGTGGDTTTGGKTP